MPDTPRTPLDIPLVEAPTRAAWRAWLEANHATSGSVWLVLNRKDSGLPVLPAAEAAEEALCFGWIDSRPGKLDARRSLLLMSPRKPGSAWSGLNKDRVARLAAAGLMAPAGIAAVDRAKADGSWVLLAGATALVEPPDLLAALAAAPGAEAAWAGFPPSHRRANLEWIAQAKRPDTRAARIAQIADRATRGERAKTWPRVAGGKGRD
ncbi:YdeI/OmpD-associated family protein [Roseomonas sp. PWR1]|uniref:YdeI/OmpD-associated family protein n=1 Tax=Roseomonas nitratireducens TaxID=2820810 RepID=A0ABS4AP72_9PROT|nr:YdeI/OmpD-associated family protein [Neoroseomonas nitratireducens]MBP0463155.1 YdeI/OmpD-associated family protein [Neoroseomonas nitratireducens]